MDNVTMPIVTSIKKHIVPAFYNWMLENDPKVYITIIMESSGVHVHPMPRGTDLKKLEANGPNGTLLLSTLTLNSHFEAINSMTLDENAFSFMCRLGGVVTSIYAPYDSILMLHCPNSGLEQLFNIDVDNVTIGLVAQGDVSIATNTGNKEAPQETVKRGHLSIVK
jgi:stringent starvation protein B